MRLLLDTHVVIWWFHESRRLKKRTREMIADPRNTIFLSAAIFWEIRIKEASGRLEVPSGFAEVFRLLSAEELPISMRHADALRELPPIHQDPFDRIMLAQARVEGMKLLSADEQVQAYGPFVIEA